MLKKLNPSLITIIILITTITPISYSKPIEHALFCQEQCRQAIDQVNESISNAHHNVMITQYSWNPRMRQLKNSLAAACSNGAKAYIFIHPPLGRRKSVKKFIDAYKQSNCVYTAVTSKPMHEKMVLVDGRYFYNTSGNLFQRIKTYDESVLYQDLKTLPVSYKKTIENEFAIMWKTRKATKKNSSVSFPYKVQSITKQDNDTQFLSSSMNFSIEKNLRKKAKNNYKLVMKKDKQGQKSWLIKQKIIKAIDESQSTIKIAANHFNLEDIADALIKAGKRGIKVELLVDNLEFVQKLGIKEKTYYFVQKWRSEVKNNPLRVRIKFYSHSPFPRYWHLMHEKFIIVDGKVGAKTKLITGSYNFSLTAEHKQFDNMMILKGEKHRKIIEQYKKRFQHYWMLNRNSNDKPNNEIYKNVLMLKENKYLDIHFKQPITLTWQELEELYKKIDREHPQFYQKLIKMGHCKRYDTKVKTLECPKRRF